MNSFNQIMSAATSTPAPVPSTVADPLSAEKAVALLTDWSRCEFVKENKSSA